MFVNGKLVERPDDHLQPEAALKIFVHRLDYCSNAIAAYLKTGALPRRLAGNRSDTKCSPVPQPDPKPGAPRRAGRAAPDRAVGRVACAAAHPSAR
jgi:hypothetical protein